MDSNVARSSKDIQRIELKPNTQESSTGNLVTRWRKEFLKRTKFGHETLNQEKHDDVTDPMSTGKLVSGHESKNRCVLTLEHVENDQTGTGKPVTVDQKEEHKIDFRVPGLSHLVVKESEHLRVQELVQRIESHPHRAAHQADLQQNNVYNPFSKDSKEMIRELGNVEFFELCETTPKVQCSHCLLSWNQGIVYCICGHCLICSESRRHFNRSRLGALSIPHYVMKKRPTHGARHGKTEVQREYHMPGMRGRDAARKLTLKVDILQVFTMDSSEIQFIVNHNSQSDGQNISAKSGMNLLKRTTHTNSLWRKREDTKDTGILL